MPYLGETFFSILLDNSFIELPGSTPKNLGKARIYLTFMSIPNQGKTIMNHNA